MTLSSRAGCEASTKRTAQAAAMKKRRESLARLKAPSAAASRHEQMLDEAARQLNASGVSLTSLANIAESLGVSRATLYQYIEDREDLVFQCYRRSCEAMARHLGEAIRLGQSAPEILSLFVERMLDPGTAEIAGARGDRVFERRATRPFRDSTMRSRRASRKALESGAEQGTLRACEARSWRNHHIYQSRHVGAALAVPGALWRSSNVVASACWWLRPWPRVAGSSVAGAGTAVVRRARRPDRRRHRRPAARADVRVEGDTHRRGRRGHAAAGRAGRRRRPGWCSRRASSTRTTTRPTGLEKEPPAITQVSQGITTLAVGQDGSSPWPIAGYVAPRCAPTRRPSTWWCWPATPPSARR